MSEKNKLVTDDQDYDSPDEDYNPSNHSDSSDEDQVSDEDSDSSEDRMEDDVIQNTKRVPKSTEQRGKEALEEKKRKSQQKKDMAKEKAASLVRPTKGIECNKTTLLREVSSLRNEIDTGIMEGVTFYSPMNLNKIQALGSYQAGNEQRIFHASKEKTLLRPSRFLSYLSGDLDIQNDISTNSVIERFENIILGKKVDNEAKRSEDNDSDILDTLFHGASTFSRIEKILFSVSSKFELDNDVDYNQESALADALISFYSERADVLNGILRESNERNVIRYNNNQKHFVMNNDIEGLYKFVLSNNSYSYAFVKGMFKKISECAIEWWKYNQYTDSLLEKPISSPKNTSDTTGTDEDDTGHKHVIEQAEGTNLLIYLRHNYPSIVDTYRDYGRMAGLFDYIHSSGISPVISLRFGYAYLSGLIDSLDQSDPKLGDLYQKIKSLMDNAKKINQKLSIDKLNHELIRNDQESYIHHLKDIIDNTKTNRYTFYINKDSTKGASHYKTARPKGGINFDQYGMIYNVVRSIDELLSNLQEDIQDNEDGKWTNILSHHGKFARLVEPCPIDDILKGELWKESNLGVNALLCASELIPMETKNLITHLIRLGFIDVMRGVFDGGLFGAVYTIVAKQAPDAKLHGILFKKIVRCATDRVQPKQADLVKTSDMMKDIRDYMVGRQFHKWDKQTSRVRVRKEKKDPTEEWNKKLEKMESRIGKVSVDLSDPTSFYRMFFDAIERIGKMYGSIEMEAIKPGESENAALLLRGVYEAMEKRRDNVYMRSNNYLWNYMNKKRSSDSLTRMKRYDKSSNTFSRYVTKKTKSDNQIIDRVGDKEAFTTQFLVDPSSYLTIGDREKEGLDKLASDYFNQYRNDIMVLISAEVSKEFTSLNDDLSYFQLMRHLAHLYKNAELTKQDSTEESAKDASKDREAESIGIIVRRIRDKLSGSNNGKINDLPGFIADVALMLTEVVAVGSELIGENVQTNITDTKSIIKSFMLERISGLGSDNAQDMKSVFGAILKMDEDSSNANGALSLYLNGRNNRLCHYKKGEMETEGQLLDTSELGIKRIADIFNDIRSFNEKNEYNYYVQVEKIWNDAMTGFVLGDIVESREEFVPPTPFESTVQKTWKMTYKKAKLPENIILLCTMREKPVWIEEVARDFIHSAWDSGNLYRNDVYDSNVDTYDMTQDARLLHCLSNMLDTLSTSINIHALAESLRIDEWDTSAAIDPPVPREENPWNELMKKHSGIEESSIIGKDNRGDRKLWSNYLGPLFQKLTILTIGQLKKISESKDEKIEKHIKEYFRYIHCTQLITDIFLSFISRYLSNKSGSFGRLRDRLLASFVPDSNSLIHFDDRNNDPISRIKSMLACRSMGNSLTKEEDGYFKRLASIEDCISRVVSAEEMRFDAVKNKCIDDMLSLFSKKDDKKAGILKSNLIKGTVSPMDVYKKCITLPPVASDPMAIDTDQDSEDEDNEKETRELEDEDDGKSYEWRLRKKKEFKSVDAPVNDPLNGKECTKINDISVTFGHFTALVDDIIKLVRWGKYSEYQI